MNTISVTARRLLGAAFIIFVIAGITLSIALYSKAFSRDSTVTLYTDSAGYALTQDAEVKFRGVPVGYVSGISPQGDRVAIEMKIDPDYVEHVPGNVSARLLPKTLFGERYVSLKMPTTQKEYGAHQHVTAGSLAGVDEIYMDPAGNATELGQVLDSLLPVLQAVPPQKLAATLGALSQALQGQGEQLGDNLVAIGKLAAGINEKQPQLQSVLRDLGVFANTYKNAGPDLVDALDNLRSTTQLVKAKESSIATAMSTAITASRSSTEFVQALEKDFIAVTADARDTLEIFARYSPVFPCLRDAFLNINRLSEDIIGEGTGRPGVRVTVEIANQRGAYIPNQDEPRFVDTRGPYCIPDPKLTGENAGQYTNGPFANGSFQPPSANPGPQYIPEFANPLDSYPPLPPLPNNVGLSQREAQRVSWAGSDTEIQRVQGIYAVGRAVTPQRIPQWIAGLAAPALRGTQVQLR